jgi:hypothetical protein
MSKPKPLNLERHTSEFLTNAIKYWKANPSHYHAHIKQAKEILKRRRNAKRHEKDIKLANRRALRKRR